MKLVIVESNAKIAKIQSYLDSLYGAGQFKVTASLGHIRDLPADTLGVDVANAFRPTYVVIPKKKKTLGKLKRLIRDADAVYLASDPDREGESIAWHIVQATQPKCPIYRVTFGAITQSAIQDGFEMPRQLDMPLVAAQESRRVIDRLVGYKVSPALWKGLDDGTLSAGRVQSVALRLICQRDDEIADFEPQAYWSIVGVFAVQNGQFSAKLTTWQGKSWTQLSCLSEADAQSICQQLQTQRYQIATLESRDDPRKPPAPFITSSLQQAASTHLKLSADRTMTLAQQLYEAGHITYMRTDSPFVSPEAQTTAREVITSTYGDVYLPAKPPTFKAKGNAQEAHECIRPTDIACDRLTTDDDLLNKLYSLIWGRFLASQMASAVYAQTTVTVAGDGGAIFTARQRQLRFDGFLHLYALGDDLETEDDDEDDAIETLPVMGPGERCILRELTPKQHFTRPPHLYSEANLVQALERQGIGRPSTYAAVIRTLKGRSYIQTRKRKLHPTDKGKAVSAFLCQHFALIMEPRFTATMETGLDKIAGGDLDAGQFLAVFWDKLQPLVAHWDTVQRATAAVVVTDEVCPACGEGHLAEKTSKKGAFLGCERYPDCDYTRDARAPQPQLVGQACAKCGAQLCLREGKRGRFLGCVRFPRCRHTMSTTKNR